MIRFLINWLVARGQRKHPSPPWASAGRPTDDQLGTLAAWVNRGAGCWAAREPGECCACGHDWIPGEIIGTVAQAYVRAPDGGVFRSPGVRLACCVCVEQQRVQGDLSIAWAREAGVL